MNAIYETDKLLSEYLLFHYGAEEEILPPGRDWPQGMRDSLGFAVRTPAHFSTDKVSRGLDLGCAVGRSTFAMAATCEEVIGIDFSHAFIQAADALARGEELVYQRREEAAQVTELVAKAPAGGPWSRLHFRQGDAMDLPADLGCFERVHAANLLCRLPEPLRLLDRLPSLVAPGGELVIATPCTWLEEYTPPGNWPPEGTFEWMMENLTPSFRLERRAEEAFLIRETARKFQWTSSLVTVWRRHA